MPGLLQFHEAARNAAESAYPDQWAGLVGAWPLFEGGGLRAWDLSGRGRNGTLTNGPTWQHDRYGNALDFDGTNDHVAVGDVLAFERTEPFSLSAWVNPQSTASNSAIVSKLQSGSPFRGWEFRLDSGGKFRFLMIHTVSPSNELFVQSTRTLTTNAWSHILVTYDGSSSAAGVKLHLNGQIEAPSASPDTLSSTIVANGTLCFGIRNGTAIPLDGRISDVRIYNRELRAGEITAIYAAGPNGYLIRADRVLGNVQGAAAQKYWLARQRSVLLGGGVC